MVPNLFAWSINEFFAYNDTPVHPILWIRINYSNKLWIFGHTIVVKNAAVAQNIKWQSQNYNTAPRLKARLFIQTQQ